MDVVYLDELLVNSNVLTVYVREYRIINVQGIIRIGNCIYCYMAVARTGEREVCGREQFLKKLLIKLYFEELSKFTNPQ